MRFHADLHIHSKYSRATSRDLDLEHLAEWACRKGVTVVGTGDFVHPGWRAELKSKLVPAEPGLFRLTESIEQAVMEKLPPACRAPVRFMLTVEISTIYKKGDRTRKIHHLLYAPDFDTADRVAASLGRIGNIASDGRPILGLDSRNLLEITLESGPGAYLIPAHIWTPWFAVLGSQSGFDSIVECYGDLSDHIFAVETGLSSDPAMNWRLSFLDKYRLTSNSDAHSPGKIGREATTFNTELDYFAIRRALETGNGYVGTVEFFPEEGKYHMDGHRKCEVRLTPEETLKHGKRCPSCGQPVTIGVLHRVEALADRAEHDVAPPPTAGSVSSLVPLPEILSELIGAGPSSKKVERTYDKLVSTLGSELSILNAIPTEEIARNESTLLAEAITRLRRGQVIREGGYDGEYGVIRLFGADELKSRTAGGLLFDLPMPERPSTKTEKKTKPAEDVQRDVFALNDPEPEPHVALTPQTATPTTSVTNTTSTDTASAGVTAASPFLAQLDEPQRRAAETVAGPLLIVAGPGAGKTRTLTHRIAHLIADHGVAPSACLAITFTRRAAEEMRERLARLVPAAAHDIPIHTFHSLGLSILQTHPTEAGLSSDFRIATDTERRDALMQALPLSQRNAESALRTISTAKRTQQHDDDLTKTFSAYQRVMAEQHWIDFDDLIGLTVQILTDHPAIATYYRDRYRWISADEFQDVDAQQYQLLTLLALPPNANLCVIGDPNQAIYGFRGADAECFARFARDYPDAAVITLTRNYRSSGTIVTASSQVIAAADASRATAEVVREMHDRITIHTAPSDRAEAEFVVHTIEQIIGGHNLFSIDSGRTAATSRTDLSFADFAVLYRTDAQSGVLREALVRSGMPFVTLTHDPVASRPEARAILDTLPSQAASQAASQALTERLGVAAEHVIREQAELDPTLVRTALQHLVTIAMQCDNDIRRFADAAALTTEADLWDPRADRITLLTMHAAKGLEFPVVFIVGLEDGILPLHWGSSTPDDAELAEERRLCYVGMTRAQDRLLLSHARQRTWRGRVQELPPSPLLRDIASALVEQSQTEPVKRTPSHTQLTLL